MDTRSTICTTTTGKQYDTPDTPLELYHLPISRSGLDRQHAQSPTDPTERSHTGYLPHAPLSNLHPPTYTPNSKSSTPP